MIVFHGNFVGYSIPAPPGSGNVTGTTMTIEFDASTLRVTDFSLGPRDPDTSVLGAGIPLDL
jgi:hypothetical protein